MSINNHLLSSLCATLSPSILPHVIHFEFAFDLWDALSARFASLSCSHIHELKTKLFTLKKNDLTMTAYLDHLQDLADKLALAGSPISDDDLVFYSLQGLPTEYNAFKMSIRTRAMRISLAELNALLLSEEIHLSMDQSISNPHEVPTALMANSSRGRVSSGGRGRWFTLEGQMTSRLVCQICGKTNHSAADCWHRKNLSYHGSSPSDSYQALVAASPSHSDSTWYVDFGATNHLTNDLSTLSLYNEYQGPDKITDGNGSHLPIQHKGSGILPTPSNSLSLPHVYHVLGSSNQEDTISRAL